MTIIILVFMGQNAHIVAAVTVKMNSAELTEIIRYAIGKFFL